MSNLYSILQGNSKEITGSLVVGTGMDIVHQRLLHPETGGTYCKQIGAGVLLPVCTDCRKCGRHCESPSEDAVMGDDVS